MNRFKNQLLLAAGFAVLTGVLSGVTAAPAIAAAVKAALIKNVDEPGRTPYQVQIDCLSVGASSSCSGSAPNISAEKRLVIEHVSALVSVGLNASMYPIQLSNGSGKNLFFTPAYSRSNPGVDVYSINQATTYYVEPGASVNVSIDSSAGQVTAYFTVVGYLVDLSI